MFDGHRLSFTECDLRNTRRFLVVALAVCVAALAAACSSVPIPAADSETSLVAALEAAGLSPGGPAENNPLDARIFSIPGVYYTAADEKVLAYEFASESEASATAAAVSPDGYGVGAKYVGWGGTPHVYVNGRLIAIYIGDTIKIKEALTAAMGEQVAGEA